MAKRLGYGNAIVIDASVCIKWFLNEQNSKHALELLESGTPFLAPDLLFAEFANVMWLKQRAGVVSRDQVHRAVEELISCFGIFDVTPCWVLMSPAIELARALSHPVYDCFYLALAEGHEIPLVTADRRFFEAAKSAIPNARVTLLGS